MTEAGEIAEGKSLAVTPTWAVASVIVVLVSLGFFFQVSLEHFGKWLGRTRRKSLLSALEKIKDELMLFGLLSLLMGHWILFVAKICVKPSAFSSRFYPCALKEAFEEEKRSLSSENKNDNISLAKGQMNPGRQYCPEDRVSFVSYETLEQIHRLVFVLVVAHVSYSFFAVVLAMLKIFSWKIWETQAKILANLSSPDSPEDEHIHNRMRRLSTFISHHASHPWSEHRIFVWLLCFSRQLWRSVSQADYMALRVGFINTHELPLDYNFHNYMLRNMEDEFRDIVGISIPLWIYAILCIFLQVHGTSFYFWLSFLPAVLILLIGTKLHRVVVKLAVEIRDECPGEAYNQLNLRDELFWFGKPRLLLWLIQLITFQNAFEMATFLWSLWEIKGSSCFMESDVCAAVRLAFGIISQFWCSFITFPLYVIVTQMSAKFKKTVVSENVRESLRGWKRRVKARQSSTHALPANKTTASSSRSGPNSPASSSKHGAGVLDKSRSLPAYSAVRGSSEISEW